MPERARLVLFVHAPHVGRGRIFRYTGAAKDTGRMLAPAMAALRARRAIADLRRLVPPPARKTGLQTRTPRPRNGRSGAGSNLLQLERVVGVYGGPSMRLVRARAGGVARVHWRKENPAIYHTRTLCPLFLLVH